MAKRPRLKATWSSKGSVAARLGDTNRRVAPVVNSVIGLAFGLLFWRRGLEASMMAHMTANLIIGLSEGVM